MPNGHSHYQPPSGPAAWAAELIDIVDEGVLRQFRTFSMADVNTALAFIGDLPQVRKGVAKNDELLYLYHHNF